MSDVQQMITRIMYVIRAKESLVAAVRPHLDKEGINIMSRSHVVMTEEKPYELYFEGWGRLIEKEAIEGFLKEEFEFGELSNKELRVAIGMDVDNLIFRNWWVIERTSEYIEIEPSWLNQNI